MRHIRGIIGILFVLLVIVVAVENYPAFSTTVKFRVNLVFFDWNSAPMSLYLVAVITFLVGLIASGCYGISERFRLKKQIKILLKEAKEKDNELNSLRNLPVTTDDINSDQPET